MSDRVEIRTAVATDLPALQRVYREASLSNAGDAPILLARPEFLVFAGDGLAEGRTLVALAGPPGESSVVGFATIADGPELEDLFVDPGWRRRGIARQLVQAIARIARDGGHPRLWVTGNPHALAFYQAAGFIKIEPISTTLGNGLRMSLDLSRSGPTQT
jgi:GNAT superfamily N-acetyltransferase